MRRDEHSDPRPAMLKVSDDPHEIRAFALMEWWAGDGAAGIFAVDTHEPEPAAPTPLPRAPDDIAATRLSPGGHLDDPLRISATDGLTTSDLAADPLAEHAGLPALAPGNDARLLPAGLGSAAHPNAPAPAAHLGTLLMERAAGPASLLALAQNDDPAATRIICDVAAHLHRPRGPLPPNLVPLEEWFAPLLAIGPAQGGPLAHAADTAARLLADARDIVPLHGDLHHENILDFAAPGEDEPLWKTIDPKGLLGERGFDYAILFCDPDLGRPELQIATRPDIFHARLAIVSEAARIERARLLDWIIAWTGLSWAWAVGDGVDAPIERAINELALAARAPSRYSSVSSAIHSR